MFHKRSEKRVQLDSDPTRPAHVTPRFWAIAKEVLSQSSTSDNEGQDVGQLPVAPREDSVAAESDAGQSGQDFEIDLSIKGISIAVAKARRDGESYGYIPPIY